MQDITWEHVKNPLKNNKIINGNENFKWVFISLFLFFIVFFVQSCISVMLDNNTTEEHCFFFFVTDSQRTEIGI